MGIPMSIGTGLFKMLHKYPLMLFEHGFFCLSKGSVFKKSDDFGKAISTEGFFTSILHQFFNLSQFKIHIWSLECQNG